MHTFYVPELIEGIEHITLSEDQSKHAIRVMRLETGAQLLAANGKGLMAVCEIEVPHKSKCVVKILSVEKGAMPSKRVSIAIAPTKNIDRIEWFCEKATEIGVSDIYFFLSKNSERKTIKLERLEKIVVAAMKQSKRFYKPVLHPLQDLNELIENDAHSNKFIAHCEEQEKIELKDRVSNIKECLILIGPEGDFDPKEIDLALQSGFKAVSLGENRLRTETAGLVACHTALL